MERLSTTPQGTNMRNSSILIWVYWSVLLLLTLLLFFLGIVCVGVGVSGSNASGESAELFFNLANLSGGLFGIFSVFGIFKIFKSLVHKRRDSTSAAPIDATCQASAKTSASSRWLATSLDV